MGRNSEPQFTAEDDATVEQQQALKPFLDVTRQNPAIVIEALKLCASEDEAVQEPLREVIGIVRLVLETEVDLDAQPDAETVKAMRSAIAEVPPEDRRLVRLATFVAAVQTWQEQQSEKLEQHTTTSVA